MTNVCIASCESYETAQVRAALTEAIGAVGGLDFISPGMRVGIKANLVSAMEPDAGATTHPALLAELCRMIVDRGAEAVVGDSPGGLYTALTRSTRALAVVHAEALPAGLAECADLHPVAAGDAAAAWSGGRR